MPIVIASVAICQSGSPGAQVLIVVITMAVTGVTLVVVVVIVAVAIIVVAIVILIITAAIVAIVAAAARPRFEIGRKRQLNFDGYGNDDLIHNGCGRAADNGRTGNHGGAG